MSMKRFMGKCIFAVAGIGMSMQAWAVWDMKIEDIVGSIDAKTAVCLTIAPESVERDRRALDQQMSEQQKQSVRGTDAYKQAFETERKRLQSLTSTERLKACNW